MKTLALLLSCTAALLISAIAPASTTVHTHDHAYGSVLENDLQLEAEPSAKAPTLVTIRGVHTDQFLIQSHPFLPGMAFVFVDGAIEASFHESSESDDYVRSAPVYFITLPGQPPIPFQVNVITQCVVVVDDTATVEQLRQGAVMQSVITNKAFAGVSLSSVSNINATSQTTITVPASSAESAGVRNNSIDDRNNIYQTHRQP